MPEPHPEFRWDAARSDLVLDRARELIRLLDAQTTLRAQNAEVLRSTWRGAYAGWFFEVELPRMQRQAAELTDELQRLVHRLEAAAETAERWTRENTRYRERQDH